MLSAAKIKISRKKNDFEKFLKKNKSKISFGFFFGGFVLDIFTLTKVDALTGNLVLSFYLAVAIFSIILMNLGDYKDIKNFFLYKIYQYSPFITQFSFGALFSGFIIYYTTSASFYTSWPFLLALFLFFLANEKFKKIYEKFEFQIAIFFASFLSLSIYFLPILLKKVGDVIFIVSGAIALYFSWEILKIIFKILPNLKRKKIKIFFNIFLVYLFFNLAYFFQIIPPVPLSIKNMEIAYDIKKINQEGQIEYILDQEKKDWKNIIKNWSETFYKKNSGRVYFFASIRAPSELSAEIIHNWKFFDENKKDWIEIQKTKYNILGGRKGGYRGFSYLSNPKVGKWRVDVENVEGFLIGRKNFEVKDEYKNIEIEKEIIK